MIYLFDDKKDRQSDFNWDDEKFSQFDDIIFPVYIYDEKIKDLKIFSSGNIILFHESFFDNTLNKHVKDSLKIKSDLIEFAKKNADFSIVFFSGSKFDRKIIDNVGYLPVSELYKNLEIFLIKLRANDFNLKYLFFGNNFNVEEKLIEKLEYYNNNFGKPINDTEQVNIVLQTIERAIPNPLENAVYEIIFEDDITDEYLNECIFEWFDKNEYDNIFIPLCFGHTLSDYNGLRLATHIRCTETTNQLKNIFIYSVVGYSDLINNEYFDILKTKNIYLISYKKEFFENAIFEGKSTLNVEELSKEIRKINLTPPKNYQDNHSIANEWAVYRWANSMDISSAQIKETIGNIDSKLYFKYLRTIFPIIEIEKLEGFSVNFGGVKKILYIDDEAEKGWSIIFENFFDTNGISFEYLDNEFNSKTRSEIIDISYNKIIKDNIDLLLLDFRLHPDDFSNSNLNEVTGIQLLKKVKDYNPGIQVIIFSATNKLWNYKTLKKEGADGFILKEAPMNSIESDYTVNVIKDFISNIEDGGKMIFLKEVHLFFIKIMNNFSTLFAGQNDLLVEIQAYLDVSFKLISNYRIDDKYLNYAYIQIFLIIELFVSQENIFEDDDTASVIVDGAKIIVQQKTGKTYVRSIKFEYGKYSIGSSVIEKNGRLDTNFKVSALLIYRFGNPNSSFHKWTSLYTVRNTKAAHYSVEQKEFNITTQEVFDLLNFVEYLSNKSKINNVNIEKGLKKKTEVDLLQELKERFPSRHGK